MKVSTKGRYGLRALVDMAANSQERPISLIQTAKRQNISLNYLEQVFGILRKAGIVASVKGAGGGYKLARSAGSITVKEILEALEGEFSIIDKNGEEDQDAVQRAIQELVWDEIDRQVNELLGQRTLEQLVTEYKENLDYSSNMYYI
ncbi:Rrf2 family transcriptional regulator [Clostridium sp. AF19-22AC]|jgi:Rrf2 family cysteine metabolism transcriptional repressor|uniref:BadM/Rrf2 family transcriptional regulator n=1 Tax=Faecalicatena orotica TaxID=1544 RepID=A0A2Y9BNZ6_9FIRM|nr:MULTISPECIES: Rrf2 family transcriptional regulator [Clostridia]PWJ23190.1 BadM/Rrf2 family transcriptional regulator [Faecalicatena orotica]RHR29489.1 Rrf2 family transcriptional regulator [Clostridium sp. AF19-22AC]SSA57927.1 transcriptional regulator, BadM/Rrf2 family [Faecalicatena orotica]